MYVTKRRRGDASYRMQSTPHNSKQHPLPANMSEVKVDALARRRLLLHSLHCLRKLLRRRPPLHLRAVVREHA